jgi:hypothetical protein
MKAGAHSWSVSTGGKLIYVEGEKSLEEFQSEFHSVWDCSSFTAAEALEIIDYRVSPAPHVYPN